MIETKENKIRINITIDPSINEKLTKLADEKNQSKSNIINILLSEYFNQSEG